MCVFDVPLLGAYVARQQSHTDFPGRFALYVHPFVPCPSVLSLFCVIDSFPVELQIRTHTRRTFILYARSQEDRDSWVSCIAQAITSTMATRSPSATPVTEDDTDDDKQHSTGALPDFGEL